MTEAQAPEFFVEVIPANTRRTSLILTANKTNQHTIWLGGEENSGIPLQPGAQQTLATTEVLKVSGQQGDWLFVSQILRRNR